MDFISNLIKRPISMVLNDTGATTVNPSTATESSSTTKLQIQDDKQPEMIGRNQSSPPMQNRHNNKCKRHAIINENETFNQPLIETRDPWQLLSLTSSSTSTSTLAMRHQSSLSSSTSTLTNTISNAISIPINSNNLPNLSDQFHDKHIPLAPLKIDLKSSTSSSSFIQTPFGSQKTPTLSRRRQSLTSSSSSSSSSTMRNISPSETIEQLLIEINDNINQAVGTTTPIPPGVVTFDDVFNFNTLIKSPNQHSPLMATKAISPLINAKSVAATATGTTIVTSPLKLTIDGSSDGIGAAISKPTNKMSRSFEITTINTTPTTSDTMIDVSLKSRTGISNSDTMQQYFNLENDCNANGDCDTLLNGHNRTTPATSIDIKDLNNIKSSTYMNKLINNKLDVVNEILSPSKKEMDDNQHINEEKIRINFEECILPEMQLNIESVEDISKPLAASSAREKSHLIIPNESDTAPSSDNELYTDCTDGGELIEKDPLSNTHLTEELLNDTNTDLDSYCSAVNEIEIRRNDYNDYNNDDNESNVLDNTADSLIDLTMDDADDSNLNNATLHVANNKNENDIIEDDVEEPMDIDLNVTLEMLNNSNNSTKTIATAAVIIENENDKIHLEKREAKEHEQSQIESYDDDTERQRKENVQSRTAKYVNSLKSQEIKNGNQRETEKSIINNEMKVNNLNENSSISTSSLSSSNIVKMPDEQQQTTSRTLINIKEAEIIKENENLKSQAERNDSSTVALNLNNQNPTQTNINDVNLAKCISPAIDQENFIREYNSTTKICNNNQNEQTNNQIINEMYKNYSKIPLITQNESLELKSENKRRTFNVQLSSTSTSNTTNIEMGNLNAIPLKKISENDTCELNETMNGSKLYEDVEKSGDGRRRTFNLSQEVKDDQVIEQKQQQEIVDNNCEPMDIDDDISVSSSPNSSTSNVNVTVHSGKLSPTLKQQQVNHPLDNNPKSTELDNNSAIVRNVEVVNDDDDDDDDDGNAENNRDELTAKVLSMRSIQKRPSIRDYKKSSSNEGNHSTKEMNVITDQDKHDDKNQKSNNEPSSMMDNVFKGSNNNNFEELSHAIKSNEQQQQQSSGCYDQEFEQQFNNNNLILQPNDFDYLLSKGNNNVPIVTDRSSLLLKFDPLIGAPVPVIVANQHQQQQQQQQQQQLFLQLPVKNNNNNNKLLSPTEEVEEEEEVEQQHIKHEKKEAKGKAEKKEADSLEILVKEEEAKEDQVQKAEEKKDQEACEATRNNQNIIKVNEKNQQIYRNENHNKNKSHNDPNVIEIQQHLTEEENLMQNTQASANVESIEPLRKQLIKPKLEPLQQKLYDLTDKEKKRHAIMSVDVDVIKDMNLDNDCNKAYENSNSTENEDKQQSNYKMDELEKKIKNEVLKTEDIEKKLKDAEQREEALIKRITEKDRTISKMNGVIEAYEKAIAEFIAEKEQLMQNYEKQLAEVKADRDSNYHHLTSLETTFSDLHVKYEKSKEMTSQLKANEEVLLGEKRQYMENLRLQEQRYEKMKSHAMQQLEIANKKLETLGREHAIETTKLKALLKKEEIARISIAEQLTQKTKENTELMKICDELIQGQES